MKGKIIFRIISSYITLILLSLSTISYGGIIHPNTVISTSTTYSNTTLDMTNGSFIVTNNATLTIQNCHIIGTLSLANPTLIDVKLGNLVMTNNSGSINVSGNEPNAYDISTLYVMKLNKAQAKLVGNSFIIDQPFSAGFLMSSEETVSNVTVTNNKFVNFHGVLYLFNSLNVKIDNNVFHLNSFGNVVFSGTNAIISNNQIFFPGHDQSSGNGIDIVSSDKVVLSKNAVATAAGYGIFVSTSHNVVVDANTITGGYQYAMSIATLDQLNDPNNYIIKLFTKLNKKNIKAPSQNITISNNFMSQNKYGVVAKYVDKLVITDNFFSQKFQDSFNRQFWTNNDILLQDVTNLTWLNNFYKEAFSQVNGEVIKKADLPRLVLFPASGGVVVE